MSLSVNDLYNSLGSTSTLSSAALKSTASADQLTSQIKDAGTNDEMMSACENFAISARLTSTCRCMPRSHRCCMSQWREIPAFPLRQKRRQKRNKYKITRKERPLHPGKGRFVNVYRRETMEEMD